MTRRFLSASILAWMKGVSNRQSLALGLAISISVLFAFTVWGYGVNAHQGSANAALPTDGASPSDENATMPMNLSTPPQLPSEPVETEVITAYPYGFEPRAITRALGPFLLAVNNHSRADRLSVELSHVAGQRLRNIPLPRGRLRWQTVLDLPPGQYVLREPDHPDWACTIVITPR